MTLWELRCQVRYKFVTVAQYQKKKLRAAKKKMFTRAKKARENIFVDTNSSLPESLSGNRYWIGVVDD